MQINRFNSSSSFQNKQIGFSARKPNAVSLAVAEIQLTQGVQRLAGSLEERTEFNKRLQRAGGKKNLCQSAKAGFRELKRLDSKVRDEFFERHSSEPLIPPERLDLYY